MSALVIDASVGLALVLRERASVDAQAVLSERLGERILTAGLFWLEVVNVLARRYGHPGASILEAIHELDELGIETIDADRAALLAVIDLVERHGLTAYDAAYLALALATGAELATADRRLALAAGERGRLIGADGGIAEEAPTYRPREPTWPMWPEAGAYLARLRAEAG